MHEAQQKPTKTPRIQCRSLVDPVSPSMRLYNKPTMTPDSNTGRRQPPSPPAEGHRTDSKDPPNRSLTVVSSGQHSQEALQQPTSTPESVAAPPPQSVLPRGPTSAYKAPQGRSRLSSPQISPRIRAYNSQKRPPNQSTAVGTLSQPSHEALQQPTKTSESFAGHSHPPSALTRDLSTA